MGVNELILWRLNLDVTSPDVHVSVRLTTPDPLEALSQTEPKSLGGPGRPRVDLADHGDHLLKTLDLLLLEALRTEVRKLRKNSFIHTTPTDP